MRRALRIALHPVVLVLLAIDVIGITLLIVSPSWGYRATVTYGSLCPFVEYCYGSQGGRDLYIVHNTAQRDSEGLFVQESHSFYMQCQAVGAVGVQAKNGADHWLMCAAHCTGTCDEVEECVKKCPNDLLVSGFREACEERSDEVLEEDPMLPFIRGDFSVGDFRGKLRLASYANACREGEPAFFWHTFRE